MTAASGPPAVQCGARLAPVQLSHKPRIERVVAHVNVVERSDRDRLGAVLAQEARERMHVLGRAMQRQHAGGGRAAERRGDAEFFARGVEQASRSSRQSACAPRGTSGRAFARRRGRAGGGRSRAAPHPTAAARAATRLACERRMTPSSMTLSPLAASVAPVVVISTMNSAVPAAGARLGRAGAFHDAVVDDAVLGKEAAGRDWRIWWRAASCARA